MTAWARLNRSANITWAVEANIRLATSPENAKKLKNRKSNIRRIVKSIRDVGDLNRPTTLGEMQDRRKQRYNTVLGLNKDMVKLLNKRSVDLPLIDDEAMARLYDAHLAWESAVSTAKSLACRWPLLEDLTERANTLVLYWWLFSQNDPYHRVLDPRQEQERLRAFRQAEDCIRLLSDGVRKRSLGRRWPGSLMVRLTIGRRVARSIDTQKDAIV